MSEQIKKLDDVDWHTVSVNQELDEDTVFAYASTHIACFLYWLIMNGHFTESEADIQKASADVRDGTLSVGEFLSTFLDGKIYSSQVEPKVLPFVLWYYDLEHGKYFNDYDKILAGREPYTFAPSQKDFEAARKIIDRGYEEYRAGH